MNRKVQEILDVMESLEQRLESHLIAFNLMTEAMHNMQAQADQRLENVLDLIGDFEVALEETTERVSALEIENIIDPAEVPPIEPNTGG